MDITLKVGNAEDAAIIAALKANYSNAIPQDVENGETDTEYVERIISKFCEEHVQAAHIEGAKMQPQ